MTKGDKWLSITLLVVVSVLVFMLIISYPACRQKQKDDSDRAFAELKREYLRPKFVVTIDGKEYVSNWAQEYTFKRGIEFESNGTRYQFERDYSIRGIKEVTNEKEK